MRARTGQPQMRPRWTQTPVASLAEMRRRAGPVRPVLSSWVGRRRSVFSRPPLSSMPERARMVSFWCSRVALVADRPTTSRAAPNLRPPPGAMISPTRAATSVPACVRPAAARGAIPAPATTSAGTRSPATSSRAPATRSVSGASATTSTPVRERRASPTRIRRWRAGWRRLLVTKAARSGRCTRTRWRRRRSRGA
jgi:hypothetical protein